MPTRRRKAVATLGPACGTPEVLGDLLGTGWRCRSCARPTGCDDTRTTDVLRVVGVE